jgi:hypothetical protein
MKANRDIDDDNDFDAAFMNDQTQESELAPPEDVVVSRPVKKKKGTSIIRYLTYGVGGLVSLFIVLVIWAVVSPENSETTGQQSVAEESIPDTSVSIQHAPVAETSGTHLRQDEESDDILLLRSQLKAAQENTAIRDGKYKILANAYIQLKADYKLLLESQDKGKGRSSVSKPEYSVLPVMKGVSIVSVYEGYAFVKKGSTVYSIKKGDKVSNAVVIEIDPVLRKVITTKGVIE